MPPPPAFPAKLRSAAAAFVIAATTLLGWSVSPLACTSKAAPPTATALTREQLEDPQVCASCHPVHVQQWSGSMHAYASDDPLFVAMNARGQRETAGQLGSFCVQCHAPLALQQGLTTDGTNLASVPKTKRGITCFFCHSVDAVTGTHNNPLHLAADGVLRASIADPATGGAHGAAYSPLHDRQNLAQASLCGACHDVTTPLGFELERTFAEWKGTVYAHDASTQQLTCAACHMPGSDGVAATVPGVPRRRVHDHSMAAVDVALTAFDPSDAQAALVQQSLDTALVAKLCVQPPQSGMTVAVTLDNAFVGHEWTSGATHDRRAWVEVIGYTAGKVVYQSGVVADGEDVTKKADPDLWLLRSKLYDDAGAETLLMWRVTSADAAALPPSVTSDPKDPAYYHSVTRSFPVPASADRVTMRVRLVPVGFDVLDDFIDAGDLDPSYRGKMPVFTLKSTVLEWTQAKGYGCVP